MMAKPSRSKSEILAAEEAIERMGGATRAATLINEELYRRCRDDMPTNLVARITVQKWKTSGIPFAWVPTVSSLSGVGVGDLSRMFAAAPPRGSSQIGGNAAAQAHRGRGKCLATIPPLGCTTAHQKS